MNELEKNYREKKRVLNGLKSLFYEDKEAFKTYLHSQSINQQAKLFAFFMANDSKFYNDVNQYTGGIRVPNARQRKRIYGDELR